jgi:hypothetical protein
MKTTLILLTAVLLSSSVFADDEPLLPLMGSGGTYLVQFSITGAPIKLMVDVIEGNWIRAEVDGGKTIWINMAQAVTVTTVKAPPVNPDR